jgi:hypothetical protein
MQDHVVARPPRNQPHVITCVARRPRPCQRPHAAARRAGADLDLVMPGIDGGEPARPVFGRAAADPLH